MATRKGQASETGTPPATTPTGATPAYGSDHNFTLQTIMEVQKTLGGLVKQIDGLDKNVNKLSDDVSKHGKWIFAANAVVLIALGILGFLAKILWDIAKVKLGVP